MSKTLKRVFLLFIMLMSTIILVGCGVDIPDTLPVNNNTTTQSGDNKTTTNSGDNNGTIAHLDSSKQGTYTGDGVTVIVYESSVSVADPSGKTLTFTIYVEGDKYYVLEEGTKNYCTFGDNTVSNSHGTFTKSTGDNNGTIAHLDSSKQGTYTGGGVTVVVSESSVMITEPSGKTFSFIIYVEGDRYYVMEEGTKTYCTFGDNTVTNSHGTFTKGGSTNTDTPAQISASLQGEYYAGPIKIVVRASSVVVTEPTGQSMEYNLYQENGKIYFYDDGEKIYCTFENDTVKNIYGTFTREGGLSTITISEAIAKYIAFLGLPNDFVIPNGASISEATTTEEGVTGYSVIVVNPERSYEEYLEYFTDYFTRKQYTNGTAGFYKEDNGMYLGAAVSYDKNSNTLVVVASKVETGSSSEDMSASEFVSIFKTKTGLDLPLPNSVTTITDYYCSDEYELISGSFVLNGEEGNESKFNQLAGIFDEAFVPSGYGKGVPTTDKYAGQTVYTVVWTKNNSYTSVTLDLVVASNFYKFTVQAVFDNSGNSGHSDTNTWPATEISAIYNSKVTIPEFTGSFTSIETYTQTQSGASSLHVVVSGVSDDDFDTYKQLLKRAGFVENEETVFVKYLENDTLVARVDAYLSLGKLTFDFSMSQREINPWPGALIEEKFGANARSVMPQVDESGKTSYYGSFAYDMINISVDCGSQTGMYELYINKLKKAGFTESVSGQFEYTFDNSDVLEVLLYRPSSAESRFSMSLTYKKYKAMEYIIPTNFAADILGFKLVKIGESYVYLYNLGNAGEAKMIKTYLYDSQMKKWKYAEGNIYTQTTGGYGHVMWRNYGADGSVQNYQYVDRPQLDEFLEGTSGLAYMYYEDMLDNIDNLTKDASKNETIAGMSCEYVTYTNETKVGSTVYMSQTVELWIEPQSKMVYKVKVKTTASGSTTNTTPYEIKSMDLTVKSFAEVGIANCILPDFNPETQTDNDHAYGDVVTVNATCGKDGVKYQVCSACGEKKIIETVPATGNHNPYLDNGEPVWASDSEGHHSHYCQDCQTYYDTTDCVYNNWTIERAATCKSEGLRTHKCTVCGYTERETIPVDRDAHLYLDQYYTDNVTVTVPTTEAAGLISIICREGCGAKVEITLPMLNETNYTIITIEDYDDAWNLKEYKMYVLDTDALITQLTAKCKPSFTLTDYYIESLFGYDKIFFDQTTQKRGFKGAEIVDEEATVPADMHGTYYNEDFLKAELSSHSVKINGEEYGLFLHNGDIYFNCDGSKVYCTINNDGSITVTYFGTFRRPTAANIPQASRGQYYNDYNEYVILQQDQMMVYVGDKSYTYNIYQNNDDFYYFIGDEPYFLSIEESENSVYTDYYGGFAKRIPASISSEWQGSYKDAETGYTCTMRDKAVIFVLSEVSVNYPLYEDGGDIYLVDREGNRIYIEFDEEEHAISCEFGYFVKQ